MVLEEIEKHIDRLLDSLIDEKPKVNCGRIERKVTILDEGEIAERMPVWQAISELWLEQGLEEYELQSIAWALARSRYDWTRIEEIYIFEVAPIVHNNLRTGAGVWGTFNIVWLRNEILKNLQNPRHVQEVLQGRAYMTELVADDWEKVKRYFDEFRSRCA